MGLEAKDILPLIPAALSTVKALTGMLGDTRVDAGVGFAEDIITFIVDAKVNGLSPEMIAERVNELAADLNTKLKFGV